MDWGANQIERLRVLAEAGMSASEIARAMGVVSRSAVISKMRREKIPLQASHGKRPERVVAAPVEPVPEPPEPAPERPAVDPVSTLEVRRGQCRWIVTDDIPFMHCGAHAPQGPYCTYHRARSYQQQRRAS